MLVGGREGVGEIVRLNPKTNGNLEIRLGYIITLPPIPIF